LEEVQADFKTITTIPAEPGGKQVNGVECCNFVDAGSSILLSAQVRDDFRAETAFDAVITVMQQSGRPGSFRLDRDPRWIGGQMMRDFPSALLRTLLCLGVEPVICPPKRPDKNPFVERYNRSYKYESLLVHRPETLQEARHAGIPAA
jgi:transposase InsO family protein